MLTREQIEAEIAELRLEVNRRVSAVKGLFAEVGGLRAQLDLLNKVLELRNQVHPQAELSSFALLGFARDDCDEPTAFCAVTWSGLRDSPSDIRLHLKTEWRSLLPTDIASYFGELFNDWKQLVQTRPAALLSMITELSVGPVRTMEEAAMRKEAVNQHIRERLGEVETLPSLEIVK